MTKITEHPYKDRKYDIIPYNSEWPIRFEKYKSKIKEIFGNVQIEHIGSTSVPGMSGKNCIDVLVIVNDLTNVESHIANMEQDGFEYAGQSVTDQSRLFRIMHQNTLLANIHFFPIGHPHIVEMLELRNYLRLHPEEVQAYSDLKKELYMNYKNDYASYRKYKDEYMSGLKKRAAQDALNSK